jgi:hypothetical protein
MTDVLHRRSLVVWNVPSALESGSAFRIKLGLKCEAACRPAGWEVALQDHQGGEIARVLVPEAICPGTTALHFVEVELRAPPVEGQFAWTAAAPATAGDDEHSALHAAASASIALRVVPAPEVRLRVVAVDRQQQRPVEGARIVVHPYRAVTDASGRAELRLPRGRFRLFVSGREYLPLRRDGELAEDTTVLAELERDVGPDDAELWS